MAKYRVDDLIIHIREGLSRVVSITKMGNMEYYLVESCHNNSETIYVPVERADNIIRPIMTKDEAKELLIYIANLDKDFNPNTKQRRDAYKRRLSSGNIKDMAYLYRQYWFYINDPDGVKLGPADIEMLEYATNFVLDELALTYDIARDDIGPYVINEIKKIEAR